MGKMGKVAPIVKQYGDQVNTIDQQLNKNGYQRFPGTMEMLLPYKEVNGRYRTGLDVDASYLLRLADEDREAEIKRITEDKKRIENVLGVPGILNSNSIFYNFAASKEQLVAKFGTDLQASPVKLTDKEEFFDGEEIGKEIAWNWLRVHPRIAPSLDAYKAGKVSSDVKYYIVDDEAETRESYNKNKEINKAIVIFEDLSPTKKKQIGRQMGLPITESTKEEAVYNLMSDVLREKEFKSGKLKGSSPLRLFNELIIMSDDRLKVKDLVTEAMTHSVYRSAQGGKITEGGITIAESELDLVEILLKEDKQQDLLILEKKLKVKKIDKL